MFVSDLLGDSGGALRVIGAISGQNETASLQINVFVSQDQIREDYIDLMAYGGNMYWLQPSEETTRPNWGKRDVYSSIRIRFFSSMRRRGMLSNRPEIGDLLYLPNADIATCGPNRPRRLVTFTRFPVAGFANHL